MNYKFTEKGEQMFSGYKLLNKKTLGKWRLEAYDTTGGGYIVQLAEGPVEIKALLDLGLIEENK